MRGEKSKLADRRPCSRSVSVLGVPTAAGYVKPSVYDDMRDHFRRPPPMSPLETSSKIGVEGLLELSGTDREAKAYAFLYAAFRRTEISADPVRDAFDCLTPFIAPYLNNIAGKQVLLDGIKQYLQSNFGFDIPLYAI